MEQYDGFIFGNGMTIKMLNQIKKNIGSYKEYFFEFHSFMLAYCNDKLDPREEQLIYKLIFKKRNDINLRLSQNLKNELNKYYSKHNSNIEYCLGKDILSNKSLDYDFIIIKSLIPYFYNIWNNLLDEYLNYLGMRNKINEFYSNVKRKISNENQIWTTNFDKYADNIMKVRHIHGMYVDNLKSISDINYKQINRNEYYTKCLWGHNGVGKLDFLINNRNNENFNEYFDPDFLFNLEYKYTNLLIYGISFQTSGWAAPLGKKKRDQRTERVGAVIDEHILLRLESLQKDNRLKKITLSYYGANEKRYLENIVFLFKLKNVNIINANEIEF